MGLVTGTEPGFWAFCSELPEGEGPRGGEVWVLDLRAQAAAGHGVRWIRQTHTEGVQSKEGALLLLKEPPHDQTQTPVHVGAPSIAVTFPGVSRWGQAGWILSAQGPGCTQDLGTLLPEGDPQLRDEL